MSKQEDYCEGWGQLYYDKMIKLQLIQQGQQNLVDSQVAEIAALKEEVARLREVVTNANGKEFHRFWLMRGKEFRIHGQTFNAGETDVLISMYAKPQEVTK
jgi:hypothetical protein